MAEPISAQEKPTEPKAESQSNALADLYTSLTENTYFKSPLVADSYRAPYNPDELWQKFGDYRVYEQMHRDDQVSVCLQLKKDLVLGDGGEFVPGDEDQDEIIDDLKGAFFEDYEGDFVSSLEEILTGYEFGFSLTEKIFKIREGGMLGLKALRTRHPNTWRLYQDDHGNIEKYEQVTVVGNLDIDEKALTHFINNPRFQNPYGTSDLRAAYHAYFAKTETVKYMAIFLEKAASPIPVGRYDKNAPQAAVDKLFQILKRFQTKTAITIPKDIEIQFLEAKNTGEAYVKAIHLFNMFIGRALFIPDLVGFTGSETGGGSLALGKEQMNLFFMHIFRRRAKLEAIINKEYVCPIVTYNHGFIPNYPRFRFKPLDDQRALEFAKVWLEASRYGAYQINPEEVNHFRKLVKFPEGDVEFKAAPIMLPNGMPVNPELDPNGNPKDPNADPSKMPGMDPKDPNAKMNDPNNAKDSNVIQKKKEGGTGKDAKQGGANKTDPANAKTDKNGLGDKKSNYAKAYKLPPGNFYKKVDFKAIESKLIDYDNSVMNDVNPIIKKMLIDLADQIQQKKIIQTQNVNRIDSLSLKYKKELKQVLKNSFTQIYKDAQSQAAQELDKSDFAKKSITPDKFLEIIDAETFKFVGDYEYGILKKTRIDLIAAIKDGKSLSEVQNILDKDLQQLSEVQIERFARTKHTEVLNNARIDFFNDSGVVSGYQYSAILDDVTTDVCAGLDGKTFENGDEPVPPLHFNCRSLLIPITKYEKFTPDETVTVGDEEQDINVFIDENKGDGFATK